MSRSPATDPSGEPPPRELDTGQGLVDPRTIHPSPEDLFPDPVVIPPARSAPSHRDLDSDEAAEDGGDDDATDQDDPGSG